MVTLLSEKQLFQNIYRKASIKRPGAYKIFEPLG